MGDRRRQAMLARLGQHNLTRPKRLHGALEFSFQIAGILWIIQFHVAYPHAAGFEIGGERTHGGEQKRDLLLVMAHIGRLRRHFRQHDNIARRVEIAQR